MAEQGKQLPIAATRLDDGLVWFTRASLIGTALIAGNSALQASNEFRILQSQLIPQNVSERMYEINRDADIVWQLASRLDYRGETKAYRSERVISPEQCPDPLLVQERLNEVSNNHPDIIGLSEAIDEIAKDLPDRNNVCEVDFYRVDNSTFDKERRRIQQLSLDLSASTDIVYMSGVPEGSRNILENKKLDGLVKVALFALSSVGAIFSFFSFDSEEMSKARQYIWKKVKRFRRK
mgnify:CR=1 FL=1